MGESPVVTNDVRGANTKIFTHVLSFRKVILELKAKFTIQKRK